MQQSAGDVTKRPTGPLNGHQFSSLAQAVAGFSAEQLAWASRYLAGMAQVPAGAAAAARGLPLRTAATGGGSRVGEGLDCRG